MENMVGCQSRVEALHRRARAQVDVLLPLNEFFAQEAERLRRHDQARSLEALGRKIAQEVSDIQRAETAASYGFNQAALITGLVKFGIGSLKALASHNREHPLTAGARLARDDFARTAPFGEVRVAVGLGGVPDDVNVVALSRQARELGGAESEVAERLEGRGYLLFMPETFTTILNELKDKVLKGTLALPVTSSSLGRHREGLSRTL